MTPKIGWISALFARYWRYYIKLLVIFPPKLLWWYRFHVLLCLQLLHFLLHLLLTQLLRFWFDWLCYRLWVIMVVLGWLVVHCLALNTWCCLIGFHNLLLLLFWDSVIETYTLKVLNIYLVTHFLLSLLLFPSLILLRLCLDHLCLWNLFLDCLFVKDVIILLWKQYSLLWLWLLLYFLNQWWLPTIQLGFHFVRQNCFVFLDDRWLVIDVSVAVGNHPTFPEILQGPRIGSLLHKQQLFMVPLIKIWRFDKRVDYPVLSVLTRTINAQMHSQMNWTPFRVLLLAIDTNLNYDVSTLLSFWCLIAAKILSRTSSSTSWDLVKYLLIILFWPSDGQIVWN